MTEQTKQKLKYWLIGLFTGGGVAAPVTAYICKKIYDKKVDEAETRGMNAMAEYAVQQQEDISKTRDVHKDIDKLFESEEDYGVDVDIDNMDLTIDDIEATEEAKERTEAHERYLDMIEKYTGTEELRPRKISGEDFSNEQYMDKSYVDWYEEDNVFEEDLNVIEDPYATFGVTDGKELFEHPELRPDADIVYIRNEKLTTDFEISRIHGSYAKMVGGEPDLGETDT